MRTLHVDTGRDMRGGQWQALYLVEQLARRSTEAVLLARAGSPLLKEAASRKLDVWPLSLKSLALAARQADLVHAHDARAHTLAAIATGIPLVVSRRVAFPVKQGFLSRRKYERAKMYLAVSRFVAAQLAAAGVSESKIRVVYDGVPIPAQVSSRTGHVVALAAKPVEIPGIPVDLTANLWEDLASASVFVYKSELEGLGSAALAALAAGVPVVASAVGGLPEVVDHGRMGFLVTDGDFASPVKRLLDHPALAESMSRAGRERAEREFSLDVMVEKTLAVYREVLGCS